MISNVTSTLRLGTEKYLETAFFIPDEKYLPVVIKRLLTRLILPTALILTLGCDGAGAFNSACCRQTCKIHAKLIFKLRLYEAEKHHFNW